MVITCENCRTRFQLDEARLPSAGARVRCSRCQHRFHVKPPPPALAPDDIASRVVENTAEAAHAHSEPPESAPAESEPAESAAQESGSPEQGTPEPDEPFLVATGSELSGPDPFGETDPLIRADLPPDGPMIESLPVAPSPKAKPEDDLDLENPEFLFDRPSTAEAADLDDPDVEPPSVALLDGDSEPLEPEPELGMDPDGLLGAPGSPEEDEAGAAEGLFSDGDDADDLFSRDSEELRAGGQPLGGGARPAHADEHSDPFAAEPSGSPAPTATPEGAESSATDFSEPDLAPPDWSDLEDAFDDDSAEKPESGLGGAALDWGREALPESAGSSAPRDEAAPLHALAEKPAAEPDSRWSREMAMGAAALALGLLLAVSAGISLARFSPLAGTGLGRVSASGWTAEVSDVFHRRAQDGERVLVVRGILTGSPQGTWLPAVRAQLVDGRGRPQGSPVWAEPAWLAGSGLAPESISAVLSLSGGERPHPRPIPSDGRATRFTALLPHAPGGASRYRLEVIPY